MVFRREFEGAAYDVFYGRCFNHLGDEHYVSLDLVSGGSSIFPASTESWSHIFKAMVDDCKNGRKVFLRESPGYDAERGIMYVPFDRGTQSSLASVVNEFLS